jgi:hypothetical protein
MSKMQIDFTLYANLFPLARVSFSAHFKSSLEKRQSFISHGIVSIAGDRSIGIQIDKPCNEGVSSINSCNYS